MQSKLKKSSKNWAILKRFPEFMSGSIRKYAGSMLCVVASVLASFLTPLLVAGAVDEVTDAMNGALPDQVEPVAQFELIGKQRETAGCAIPVQLLHDAGRGEAIEHGRKTQTHGEHAVLIVRGPSLKAEPAGVERGEQRRG